MPEKLSERISTLVHALPLYPGIRVLEVGCGPGAAARAVAGKIGNGFILAIDRSEKANGKAISNSQEAIKTGKLSYRIAEIGKFQLEENEEPYDLAFRVGAFDGRHPEIVY